MNKVQIYVHCTRKTEELCKGCQQFTKKKKTLSYDIIYDHMKYGRSTGNMYRSMSITISLPGLRRVSETHKNQYYMLTLIAQLCVRPVILSRPYVFTKTQHRVDGKLSSSAANFKENL